MSFNSIPIIDLEQAFKEETRQKFLGELCDGLISVGFLLLTNFERYGPTTKDFEDITRQAVDFFALPQKVKDEVDMINSPHFLGYTKMGNEITSGRIDWREQIDLATELSAPLESEPLYRQLEGPNLWPDEKYMPHFKECVSQYICKMTSLSRIFSALVAEAIGIPPKEMEKYFKEKQQCKMKIIAYPPEKFNQNGKEEQGVGPHKDSDFLTFVYQASEHKDALQVQNFEGQWVSVDNTPGSLVVNVGQTLEAITCGVCKATIHRVLRPKEGSGTRLSIPFFQTINLDIKKRAISNLPQNILRLKEKRDKAMNYWGKETGFQYSPDLDQHPVGYAVFRNRIKSHRDVAAKWYPEVLKEVLYEINEYR